MYLKVKSRKSVTLKLTLTSMDTSLLLEHQLNLLKGGVLIYIKNGINFKPRNDLIIYKSKELESFFIEINNPKETNSVVGVIYRHPCMNEQIFNDDYLQKITDILSLENKTNSYFR